MYPNQHYHRGGGAVPVGGSAGAGAGHDGSAYNHPHGSLHSSYNNHHYQQQHQPYQQQQQQQQQQPYQQQQSQPAQHQYHPQQHQHQQQQYYHHTQQPQQQHYSQQQLHLPAATPAAPPPSQPQPLPPGWVQTIDPTSGKTYYANATTGESRWDPPLLKPMIISNTTAAASVPHATSTVSQQVTLRQQQQQQQQQQQRTIPIVQRQATASQQHSFALPNVTQATSAVSYTASPSILPKQTFQPISLVPTTTSTSTSTTGGTLSASSTVVPVVQKSTNLSKPFLLATATGPIISSSNKSGGLVPKVLEMIQQEEEIKSHIHRNIAQDTTITTTPKNTLEELPYLSAGHIADLCMIQQQLFEEDDNEEEDQDLYYKPLNVFKMPYSATPLNVEQRNASIRVDKLLEEIESLR